MITRKFALCLLALGMFSAAPTWGQFDSGSDGSDGAFNPLVDVEIDLGLAATASWDTPSPVAGQGVYDADKWAVVFKYTTIDVPGGVTVTFKNHPSGAPVVWLALGNIDIGGLMHLDGRDGAPAGDPPTYAEPGPGGFAGGVRWINDTNLLASGGFWPGGGMPGFIGAGGGFGTAGAEGSLPSGGDTYGNEWILPVIGGSGDGGGHGNGTPSDAGAGGGAILIASSGDISLNTSGMIHANGGASYYGSAGGAGGGIRLIANAISGSGVLRATRYSGLRSASGYTDGETARGGIALGGDGRIRVEAYVISLLDAGNPPWTWGIPGPVFPPAGAPTLKATFVDGQPVPADPKAGVLTSDVAINDTDPVTIDIEATNIPVGTTVQVRIVPERGDVIVVDSSPLVDVGGGLLTASATVTFPPFRSEMQLRANWTP